MFCAYIFLGEAFARILHTRLCMLRENKMNGNTKVD